MAVQKQMKSIKVTPYVKKLSELVTKKVIVASDGNITTINGALEHVFESYLEKGE